TLELRAQIKLVDLAIIKQAARAVAAIIGVAGDLLAKLQDGDAAALADRRIPPIRATPGNQLIEFVAGDDALIGGAPSLVMSLGDVGCVRCLGATNLYDGRAHCRIEATNFAPFKPYGERSVNGVDYWPQEQEIAHYCCRNFARAAESF